MGGGESEFFLIQPSVSRCTCRSSPFTSLAKATLGCFLLPALQSQSHGKRAGRNGENLFLTSFGNILPNCIAKTLSKQKSMQQQLEAGRGRAA